MKYLKQIDKPKIQRQQKKQNYPYTSQNFGFRILKTINALIHGFAFFFLFLSQYSKGQTIYGVSGIIKTPNAYVVNNDKFVFGTAYFKDYHNNFDKLFIQWTLNLNMGVLSRFEFGVRLAILPDVTGDSPIYDVSFDRVVSGKFILLEEKDMLPQIAFGMQDIIGTRLHNSTYFVTSKTLKIKDSYSFLLNLGYGTKLNDFIFGDARNHHFIGFFGGTEIGFKKRLFLMAECDARDINSGLKLVVKNWLNFNFSLLKLKVPSAGLSLKFSL